MDTEAQRAKDALARKPELTGTWKPETFWDETPLDDNLYSPVLNRWIREIKRQLVPVVLDDLNEQLTNARKELVEFEKQIAKEDDQTMRGIYKDEANEVRIDKLEREWNNHQSSLDYLNTPSGALWLQGMLDKGNGDIISRKVLQVITTENCPPCYLERLQNQGVDKYNEIIRSEKDFANDMAIMTMGVALAIGDPGAGKSAFLAFWSYMMKYLFGYKAILDVPPRKQFGEWYLFNVDKLKLESEKANLINAGKLVEAGIEIIKDDDGKPLPPEAQWAAANFARLFQRAVFGAEEYSDYYPRLGQGRTRMGAACFNFHRKWRHDNLLVVGATPKMEEIDINMCQRYITHEVRVQPHPEARDECTQAFIYPRRVVQGQYVTNVKSEPFEFNIWGLEPRDFLGGDCFYHIFNTKNRQRIKLPRKLKEGD
jgi:hypothetical protein